jgi:O-antigen ligase
MSGTPVRRESRLVSGLFLLAVFCATFEKVHWNVAGAIYLADLTTIAFLAGWTFDRLARPAPRRAPRTAAVLLLFLAAFLLVYLLGFFNLDTKQALDQFLKGLAKWVIHFGFLVVAVAYLAGRTRRYFWRALTWFLGGIVVNAGYGILQLLVAQAGGNLDSYFVRPVTRGASQINIYGAINGSNIYRPNALTGDPNHLAIMLLLPILVVAPLYLRLERGHRLRVPFAVLLAFLLLMELATLSRSGLLGLAVGAFVLAFPYRRFLLRPAFFAPIVLAALPIVFEVARRFSYFDTVIRSRLQTSGKGTEAHFGVYSFIPDVLHVHPLFGLGYNNFAVYYEFVTGKPNWGPHSYYVALLVEGGIVGALVFAAFIVFVFRRLRALRHIGRALAAAGNVEAARVRPLAWGLTAALVATLAANAFYLTVPLFYFSVFVAFALAAPVVFGRQRSFDRR